MTATYTVSNRSLADRKNDVLSSINVSAQADVAQFMVGYPDFEIQTWPTQQAEAEAYQANSSAATPFCDTAAQLRGISRDEFITKVIAKAALFRQVSAMVAGYRQKLEDQINAVTDTTALTLDSIVWVSPLQLP